LDFAIEGNGMFVVHDGNTEFYTRAGNFYLDQDGTIVNADGYILQGEDGEIEIPLVAQSISVDKDGVVDYVDTDGEPQVAGQIQLANFTNTEGLEKAGNNLYLDSANSANANIVNHNPDGAGAVDNNALEMSNMDLAKELPEMITEQRGFQTNTKILTTSDEI